MTFQEFQATRQHCDNLGEKLADARWDGEPPAKGFIYEGGLYIEEIQPHWPAQDRGKYYLIIGRNEWLSDDLPMLERELYNFGLEEQILCAF